MTPAILPSNILEYLTRTRGLSLSVIEKMKIGWDGSRIVIPVNGQFNKYRRSPFSEVGPKYMYEKGATAALYNIDSLQELPGWGKTVVITEGEMDVLTLDSCAIPAVSSTGGCGTFKEEWIPLFKDFEVYICYDNDDAGMRGAIMVQSMIPHAKIMELPRSNGIKDVGDFFNKTDNPIDPFLTLMDEAKNYPLPVENSDKPSQMYEEYTQSMDNFTKQRREALNDGKPVELLNNLIEFSRKKAEAYERIVKRGKSKDFVNKDPDKIKRAKAVPLPPLLKFNASGFAQCLWHKDSSPSLHYIEKTNSVYCFACNSHGDVIDVYMKINNRTLTQALEALNK